MIVALPFSSVVLNPDRPLDLAGRRIHFVGVGGCGMSGLARIAQQQGALCTGSDQSESPMLDLLRRNGIDAVAEQTADTLPADAELVVASAAIKPDHPELAEARKRGIPTLKYAQMLGRLMIGRTGVAISGTHGKSTTTSMLAHILIQTGLDPSFIVGANCRQIGGGSRVGGKGRDGKGRDGRGQGDRGQGAKGAPHSAPRPLDPSTPSHSTPHSASRPLDPSAPSPDILVAEACEYDRSFHNFHPTHGVILNVEIDHLDLYGSIEEIAESFAVFARKLPPESAGGSLLIHHELPQRLAITADLDCAVETIGFAPNADWRVGVKDGHARLHRGRDTVMDFKPPLPGEHMAYNAAVAAVTAHRLGADWGGIQQALESFEGLDRRMQKLGERDGVTVIDDYGHHPTEVDTTLRALRGHYNPSRLICVFQPHQHSRTRFLMGEFAASFSAADIAIVPEIYFSRDSEAERRAVTAADLVDRLRQKDVRAMHLYPFIAIVEQLRAITRPGDLVVTMGAGDVWKIARDYLAAE